jgi:peptidoglycan endopeptidase LytF
MTNKSKRNIGGIILPFFKKYTLQAEGENYCLTLYVEGLLSEFANELGQDKDGATRQLQAEAENFARKRFPWLKITVIKIVIGTLIVSTFSLFGKAHSHSSESTSTTVPEEEGKAKGHIIKIPTNEVPYILHKAKSGEDLNKISKDYQVTMKDLLALNLLETSEIKAGQLIKIPFKSQK